MTPRMRRGHGVRAILAGGLLATMAIATLPSSAAFGEAPALVRTSVDTGWSNMNDPAGKAGVHFIGADFDKLIDIPSRDVVVKDLSTATEIAGSILDVPDPDPNDPAVNATTKSIIWQANAPLIEDGRQYSVEFTAEGVEGTPPTIVTKTFSVDTRVPAAPLFTSPTGITTPNQLRQGFDVRTTLVTDPVAAFEGYADDKLGLNGDPQATSGIQRIELWFWSVEGQLATYPIDLITNSPGDADLRHKANQACSAKCPQVLDPWTVDILDIEELSCFICSVRAVAFDYAGNVSAPSDPITFINQ